MSFCIWGYFLTWETGRRQAPIIRGSWSPWHHFFFVETSNFVAKATGQENMNSWVTPSFWTHLLVGIGLCPSCLLICLIYARAAVGVSGGGFNYNLEILEWFFKIEENSLRSKSIILKGIIGSKMAKSILKKDPAKYRRKPFLADKRILTR